MGYVRKYNPTGNIERNILIRRVMCNNPTGNINNHNLTNERRGMLIDDPTGDIENATIMRHDFWIVVLGIVLASIL